MYRTAQIRVRIDPDLKRDAEAVLAEIGLTHSAAVTLFYKQIVRLRTLPLDLSLAPPPPAAEAPAAAMREAEPMDPEIEAVIDRLDQLMRMKGI
jgi:DNA-damage-inducible protein J